MQDLNPYLLRSKTLSFFYFIGFGRNPTHADILFFISHLISQTRHNESRKTETQRKPGTFIYLLISRHLLSCAKLHVGCWEYIDKTGQILAPKEVLVTEPHLHQGALIFFQAWRKKVIPKSHRPGSANCMQMALAHLTLWKENKADPQHRNNLSDPYILPTKRVLLPPGPKSFGIRKEREWCWNC